MKYVKQVTMLAIMTMAIFKIEAADLVLDTFDNLSDWKVRNGKIESGNENGNKVMKLTAPDIMATRTWKFSMNERYALADYQGLSFRVKGDNSNSWSSVSISCSSCSWGWNYICYFQIKGADWQTITLAWDDFLPSALLGDKKINAVGALTPVGIDTVTLGDHWTIEYCNKKIPPFSYLVDDLKLVEKAQPRVIEKYPQRQLSDVIAKMKSGQAVTIFCAGDSITAGVGVTNPEVNRYAVKLQAALRNLYGNNKITVKTIAVGGAQCFNLRTWAERDFLGEKPDLVTLHIGYNDKSAGLSAAFFRASVSEYMDRISSITGGSAAFLLLSTIPGQAERFTMLDDYADAVRSLARERNIAMYDLAADFKALGPRNMSSYFSDTAHPNNQGNELIAGKLTTYFAGQK
ncbi:MAG: SGNH/GDSL hydrolase family protein [Victivallaceae bacterium]|jgi:lysophospholipase L1-like esterase